MSINRFTPVSSHDSGHYDTAQICRNGHVINGYAGSSPEFNQAFCDRCGEKTITACAKCGKNIRGEYQAEGILSLSGMNAPAFCLNCGVPFPWTSAGVETAKALADELDELSPEDRVALHGVIDDLVSENPRTPLAIVRFKKVVSKVGKVAAEAFKKILIDVVTDTAKKQIWGP